MSEYTFNYRCERCSHVQTHRIKVNLDFFRCPECGSTALKPVETTLGASPSNSGVEGHAATTTSAEIKVGVDQRDEDGVHAAAKDASRKLQGNDEPVANLESEVMPNDKSKDETHLRQGVDVAPVSSISTGKPQEERGLLEIYQEGFKCCLNSSTDETTPLGLQCETAGLQAVADFATEHARRTDSVKEILRQTLKELRDERYADIKTYAGEEAARDDATIERADAALAASKPGEGK